MSRQRKACVEKVSSSPDSRKIGYARVSTDDQDLRMQVADLKAAGVDPRYIFVDKKSGATLKRHGLQEAMAVAQAGDEFYVWRFDRLSRSLKDLIEIADHLKARGVHLKSIKDGIDTTNAVGVMFYQMIGVFAEFERNLTRERTASGVRTAQANGVWVGRVKILTPKQVQKAIEWREAHIATKGKRGKTIPEIAKRYRASVVTVRNAILAANGGKKLWKTGPHAGRKRRKPGRFVWQET